MAYAKYLKQMPLISLSRKTLHGARRAGQEGSKTYNRLVVPGSWDHLGRAVHTRLGKDKSVPSVLGKCSRGKEKLQAYGGFCNR